MSIILDSSFTPPPDSTATVEFTEYLRLVRPYTPGAPDVAVVNALRDASREFFERTHAWTRNIAYTVTATEGQSTFALGLPSGQEGVKLLAAKVNSRPVRLVADEDKDHQSQTPSEFEVQLLEDMATVYVQPTLATGARLNIRVTIRPSFTATTIGAAVGNKYAKSISYGAVAILTAEKDKAYSDPQLAMANAEMFESAITRALVQKYTGHARTQSRSYPSYF